jgi:hypothetical protein
MEELRYTDGSFSEDPELRAPCHPHGCKPAHFSGGTSLTLVPAHLWAAGSLSCRRCWSTASTSPPWGVCGDGDFPTDNLGSVYKPSRRQCISARQSLRSIILQVSPQRSKPRQRNLDTGTLEGEPIEKPFDRLSTRRRSFRMIRTLKPIADQRRWIS